MNALNLIEFLLKNGSELIRDGITDEIFVIKTFKSFYSEESLDNNLSDLIQSIAGRITNLLENKLMLADERRKARKLRLRFTGQSGGEPSMNPEKELENAEKQIEEEIEKCAQKSEAPDPRYVGFSSEDYMKEIEEKKIAQKFVGSYGKDDEQVEQEMKSGEVDDDQNEEEEKKKKNMPKPPSKKPKATLREKLGISEKIPKKTDPAKNTDDFDFLGGSVPRKPNESASIPEETDELLQLTDLTPANASPEMDLVNPSDEMDLIDFGNIPAPSNTGIKKNDIDLLLDCGGPLTLASSAN